MSYANCEATIDAERLVRFSKQMAALADKDLRAAQRSGLRAVGNKTLREMRKLIVAEVPGAKLPPGYTKRTAAQRRDNIQSDLEIIYDGSKPLAKSGKFFVKKDGSGVTISAMQPPLLRMFTAGAKRRITDKGYWRGQLMKRNAGEGGDFIKRAGAIVAPSVGKMLDEIIMKQIERKFKRLGYDL